jgi:hypothetical protein
VKKVAKSSNDSLLTREWCAFQELSAILLSVLTNKIFDLHPKTALRRLLFLIFSFLMSGLLIPLIYYPFSIWLAHIQDIFGYLLSHFNFGYIPYFPGDPFFNIIIYAYVSFTDPRVLMYLPIFLVPFFVALQIAANFLSDIYELNNPNVARRFVSATAFIGSNQTIRISQGKVIDKSKDLPISIIGGPGKVFVDLDSVAVFEMPDGTPHIIGPTNNEPDGKAILQGFERLRQAIDIRNQYIELRDTDKSALSVTSRSRDGIPIKATDVKLVYSVHRGGKESGAITPYPFNKTAVENIVYKATSHMTLDLKTLSNIEFSWSNNTVELIRTKLSSFISHYNTSEFLARISLPEFTKEGNNRKPIEQEHPDTTWIDNVYRPKTSSHTANLLEEEQLVAILTDSFHLTKSENISDDLFFAQRIPSLLTKFAEEFTADMYKYGVQLTWSGTGRWILPSLIFPGIQGFNQIQIENWRLNRANLAKGSEADYKNELLIREIISLMQTVPISVYQISIIKEKDYREIIWALVLSYRQQLIDAAELWNSRGNVIPTGIIQAIEHLNDALDLNGWRWSGIEDLEKNPFVDRPYKTTHLTNREGSEEQLYNELVILVQGDTDVANRLIEQQQQLFPKENRRKWIERARDKLLHDRGAFTP